MMDPYLKEIERLQKLYDKVLEEEVVDEQGDSGSETDHCEISDHNTDTEEDISNVETKRISSQVKPSTSTEEETGNVDTEQNQLQVIPSTSTRGSNKHLFYHSKAHVIWKKHALPKNVRTRSCNIITFLPGTKGNARNAIRPLDCWTCFIDNNIIETITASTNIFISKVANKYKDKNEARLTNQIEMKALIGLLYLAGLFKSGRRNSQDFWASDGTGVEVFPATMAHRRFVFLLRCLRFDDVNTRDDRKKEDKMAPIREVFECFNQNCKNNYIPGAYLTLDEMLFAFRGRCSFRMYLPNKPARYGIKVFSLADARTFYTVNMEVYLGTQPPGPYCLSSKTPDLVERMCQPISGSARNVTMDNWFTSFEVATRMLEDHKITIVGTMRRNKREVPREFLAPNRPQYSSIFGFRNNMTLVSYCPKKNKSVLVLSSFHFDDSIDPDSGESSKPDIVTFYNITKSGVDSVDQKSAAYNASRNTRRWPMAIFYNLLNIAGINSFVVHKSNARADSTITERRLFLKELGLMLVKENMTLRANDPHIKKEIRQIGQKLSGTDARPAPAPEDNKRGRCAYCRNRKTKYFCRKCHKWLCLEHVTPVCQDCFQNGTDD